LELWRSKGKGGAKQVQLLQETGWFDWFHLSMRESACSFDYLRANQDAIANANAVVKAKKLDKI
ncbi:unnamed protein product, partial [Musa hybrid cultivar]